MFKNIEQEPHQPPPLGFSKVSHRQSEECRLSAPFPPPAVTTSLAVPSDTAAVSAVSRASITRCIEVTGAGDRAYAASKSPLAQRRGGVVQRVSGAAADAQCSNRTRPGEDRGLGEADW